MPKGKATASKKKSDIEASVTAAFDATASTNTNAIETPKPVARTISISKELDAAINAEVKRRQGEGERGINRSYFIEDIMRAHLGI